MAKTARLGLVKPGHGINVVEGQSPAGAPNEAANLDAIDSAIAALQDASGAGGIQFAIVNVTNDQLKAMSATKVAIVPAQGAGKVIIPVIGVARYKFGTVPFTLPGDPATLILFLGADANLDTGTPTFYQEFQAIGFFDQSADKAILLALDGGDPVDVSLLDNQPLSVMFINTADPATIVELTDGDGTMRILVAYYVMDVD